jgi:thiamine biosynthesis lipoprotein
MNRRYIILILLAIAVFTAVLFYPKSKKEYKKISGYIQGTTYHVTYEYAKNKDLKPAIEKLLGEFDLSLSIYEPNSVISKINRNDSTVMADELFTEVFRKSEEVYTKTNGAFDITVAPIVNAWGFGSTPGSDMDSAMIDSLLHFVGMDKVKLEDNRVEKDNPSVMLDVNAIAQGLSVDIISRFLDRKKVNNYLVEIGGELRSKGLNPKSEDWKIGIDKPVEGNMDPGKILQAILAVKGKSLATSGNYRKFYEKNGIKYAHCINPKTGYPAWSRLLSVTILADDCITADAYATAIMVMGLDKGIDFLSSHRELEALLIYNDEQGNYKIYATEGMKPHIVEVMK